MLQIYHGNGKGKTTAAVGQAVRAAGAGMKIYFCQFLKDGKSSEIGILRGISGISVQACAECGKFVFQMNEAERQAVTSYHDRLLEKAAELSEKKLADMIVLDEFLDAYNLNMLDRAAAQSFIERAKKDEIILTGRNPDKIFIDSADYISEIISVRHPYENGTAARKGIEY